VGLSGPLGCLGATAYGVLLVWSIGCELERTTWMFRGLQHMAFYWCGLLAVGLSGPLGCLGATAYGVLLVLSIGCGLERTTWMFRGLQHMAFYWCGLLAVGLSGPLGGLEGYSMWRSTLSIAKLSLVRSNIFACECGV